MSKFFSLYFDVYRQQWSTCGKKRIDIVMRHKVDNWLTIGVEIKNNACKHGKDLGAWLNQARNYNNYEFINSKTGEGYGVIPIVVYPTISGKLMEYIDPNGHHHGANDEHHNINSFLAKSFCVGEIRKRRPEQIELTSILFNNRTIWKEWDRGQDTTNRSAYEDTIKLIKKFDF